MAGSFARERDPLTLPGASFERTYQSADPQRAKTILMADAISEYKSGKPKVRTFGAKRSRRWSLGFVNCWRKQSRLLKSTVPTSVRN